MHLRRAGEDVSVGASSTRGPGHTTGPGPTHESVTCWVCPMLGALAIDVCERVTSFVTSPSVERDGDALTSPRVKRDADAMTSPWVEHGGDAVTSSSMEPESVERYVVKTAEYDGWHINVSLPRPGAGSGAPGAGSGAPEAEEVRASVHLYTVPASSLYTQLNVTSGGPQGGWRMMAMTSQQTSSVSGTSSRPRDDWRPIRDVTVVGSEHDRRMDHEYNYLLVRGQL